MLSRTNVFGNVAHQLRWRQTLAYGALMLLVCAGTTGGACLADDLGGNSGTDATDLSTELKVDDVNDLGYALQRIRQQAVNIYVEAVRKTNSPAVTADLPPLTKVPSEIPKDNTNLLPFRRPWLVYFVTTMEPLVHLLKEDVKDLETGAAKINVQPATRKAMEPLLQEWALGVKRIDEQLTAITLLVDDADKNNVELAKIASSLDKEVSRLELVRDRCYVLIEKMEHSLPKVLKPKT